MKEKLKQLLLWLQSKIKRKTVVEWLRENSYKTVVGKKSLYFQFAGAIVRYSDHFTNKKNYFLNIIETDKVFIITTSKETYKKPFVYSKRDNKKAIQFIKTALSLNGRDKTTVESFEEIKNVKEEIFKTKSELALESKRFFQIKNVGWKELYNVLSNLKQFHKYPKNIKEDILKLMQINQGAYMEIYTFLITYENSTNLVRTAEFDKIYAKYIK